MDRQKVKFLGEGQYTLEGAKPQEFTTGTVIEVSPEVATDLLTREVGGKKQWEPAEAEPAQVQAPQTPAPEVGQ